MLPLVLTGRGVVGLVAFRKGMRAGLGMIWKLI
jgi:hypothetical protein